MAEEKKLQDNKKKEEKPISPSTSQDVKEAPKKNTNKGAAQAVAKSVYGERKMAKRGKFRRDRGGRPQDEYDQQIVDLARVTRVMAGGKRMRFRACVAIGNKKGEVAVGLAKGADVAIAVSKAVTKAKKNIIKVSIVNNTIPHEVFYKYGAAKILFKPARKGRGVIAGGAVRIILELAGIKNVTSKILGTNNKVTNVKCAIEALKSLKKVESKKKKSDANREKHSDISNSKSKITNSK